ncbi:hypothetical protein D3C81_1337670 [compost metagenome]
MVPLTTKWSPSSRALVFRLARSEPAFGSEKPWHQRISPRAMGVSRSRFCCSLPYSSSTGPSIQMPRLICAGRHLRRRSSLSSTASSAGDSPPPPYSVGQSGQNQPLSRMRSNHRRWSSLLNSTWLPPHTSSPSGVGVRCEGGQLASSQARVSWRKSSIALICRCPSMVRRGLSQSGPRRAM